MMESSGDCFRSPYVLQSRAANLRCRSVLNTAGGTATLSCLLLLLAPAPTLRASLCVPVGNAQPIHFSAVLRIDSDASSSGSMDMWALSDQSVYRITRSGKVDTFPLQGQLQRDAFVVYRDSIFIGTTQGAMRFTSNEPDVSLTFTDGGRGASEVTRPAIHFASIAFDTVLLSGLTNVYAVDKSGKNASRTSLPPGRAYGHGPYWWVTKRGVYRLAADLSVSAPLTVEEPASVPVIVADRLWFVSQSCKLISVPKDASADVVPGIPGRVLAVTAAHGADPATAKEVWAATDQALKRIEVTAAPNSPFLVTDEVKEGNIKKVLVLKDRLFFSRCARQDAKQAPDQGCVSPTVLEKLLLNGHAEQPEARTVAERAGTFWMADADAGVLYVPTENALIRYTFATRNAEVFYNRPTRFVFPWGGSLLLGSPLSEQKVAQLAAGSPPPNSSGLGDLFANLCALEPNAQLSAKFSGAEAFDWYLKPFGKPILFGGKLLLTPVPPPNASTLPAQAPGALQICTASCEKEDSWSSTAVIPAGSGWVSPQTFDYTIRSQRTGDRSDLLHGRIFFISQGALWAFLSGFASVATGLVLIWLAGGVESHATVSARRLLFQTLPASGKLARVNIPLGMLIFFDAGVWWFLRPVLRSLSEFKTIATEVDKEVADATRKDGLDGTYVVAYDLPRDEAEPRTVAICKIIASDSLNKEGPWRLPLIVRLSEFSDGDVKKALMQLLQHFKMSNAMLIDRIIESGKLVYLFTGVDELKDKAPISALLVSAHSQQSRSVIITKNPLQLEKSALYKTIFRAEAPPAGTQDLK